MKRLLRIIKKVMIITLSILLLLTVITFLYMRQDKFGKAPSGARLERIQQASNYRDGAFQNISPTPTIVEGYRMTDVIYDQLFNKNKRRNPTDRIPSIKNDLLNLPPDSNVLVWFGHSSYFLQIDGKKFLIDPVFSGNASPVPGTTKSFEGTDIYQTADLPDIDFLLISHDHYDHLDYETIIALNKKVKKVICGLGVGAHFEHWGYSPDKIIEKNWYEKVELDSGFAIHTTPARHFSGRGFTRNNTLWMSYLVQTPRMKVFIGGDSGYDTHYGEIGNKYGPIDLAILDNGQYNPAWRYIHALPEENVKAAVDLRAKRLFPVHSSKFVLANHPWDEPLIKITELSKTSALPLVTPMIGEIVNLNDTGHRFEPWWVGVK